MYYTGDIERFLRKNTAIIGKREAGKTTILKKLIKYCYTNDYTILLFDSATDHADKSLLVDTVKNYVNTIVIQSPSKEEIHFDSVHSDCYPHLEIKKTTYNIYAFDVSKYLEEGYDTDDLVEREAIRKYYKQLVMQELAVMVPIVSKRRSVVIMDEIEFLPQMKKFLRRYKLLGVPIVTAIHDKKSLSTSSLNFNILTLK